MNIDVKVIAKFLAAIGAALAQLLIALADEHMTPSEWVMVAIAFVGALTVYAVPNAVKMHRDNRGRFAPPPDDE